MKYYDDIKLLLINNEVVKRVKDYSKNRSDLNTYYNVGKLLHDAGKHYGENIIKEYSDKLTKELGKGYSERSLRNMRQFYIVSQKWQTVSAKLSYSHYCELIWFNIQKINYYIKIVDEQNLSVRELRNRIKSNEYERLPDRTKEKLIKNENIEITDLVKNPIIIKNNNYETISEKVLQKLILEDISSFLKQLGNGFTFIDNEYKIKIDDRYNYIDLLLYNIKYKSYVVVELKTMELKKEYIGQVEVYMNYIDKNIKTIEENKTIGIILCKEGNELIMEYCSDKRIFNTTYKCV